MSALLKSKIKILNSIAVVFVAAISFGPAFAQEQSLRPGSSSGSEVNESPSLPPADISDLGEVTVEGLKEKPIYWMCRNGSTVRTLRVGYVGGGCNTFYAKEGLERVVSQAMGTHSCLSVFGNIRRNLQAAGWKCRDISDARLSSSP